MPVPDNGRRVLRYAAAGGTAALVDLAGFALLLSWSVPLALAGTASFAAALLVNFSLSSRYVFHVSLSLQRLPVFALGALLGLTLNMGVTVAISALGVTPLLAKAAGICAAFAFNYSVNVLVVYRR